MELRDFEFLWRELYIDSGGKRQIYLTDMLGKFRGEREISGMPALQFDPVNEEDPIFLTIDSDPGGSTYCLKWNEDKDKWECLGKLLQTYEWGPCMLNRYWSQCAMKLASGEMVYLKNSIAFCMGEKCGGLLFKGKGIWEDKTLILKLDREYKLGGYFEEQICYRLNKDNDDWEFFGMLVKQPPARRK